MTWNTKAIKYVIIQQFLIIVFATQLHKDVSALPHVAMELLVFTMSKCTNAMYNTLSLCNHIVQSDGVLCIKKELQSCSTDGKSAVLMAIVWYFILITTQENALVCTHTHVWSSPLPSELLNYSWCLTVGRLGSCNSLHLLVSHFEHTGHLQPVCIWVL
jgi:hypothetical protein